MKMNQSVINGFFVCLSRMAMTDNDRYQLIYQNLNHSILFGKTDNSQDNNDHNHLNGNGVVMAKATAMLVLFCATIICGVAPFFFYRHIKGNANNANARSATVVKCLLYFGGGVLLCTTFLHLLPEVRETVEGLKDCGTFPAMAFPFVELLMCCGFFLMYFIEELIHTYIHRNKSILDEETSAFERGHSIRNSHIMRNVNRCEEDTGDRMNYANGNEICSGSVRTISKNVCSCDMENQKDHQKIQPATQESTPTQVQSHYNQYHNHSHYHQHQHHSHLAHKSEEGDDDMIASHLRGLLIVLALSTHELFEGLAIGLEASASNVWFMFAAVSAHKLVLAFCVGVELIVARTKTYLSVLFIFTFAIVSPLGIGIGMLVSNHNTTASSIPSAILQGLACGTLLYVVFFEILSKDRSGLLAYLGLIVGFGLMFGLQQLFSGHQHSHGDCSHSHSHSHTADNQQDSKYLTTTDIQQLS